jgi:hypothetical protein
MICLLSIIYSIKLIFDIIKRCIEAYKIIPDFINYYKKEKENISTIISLYYIQNVFFILLSSFIFYNIIVKLYLLNENIHLYIIILGIISSIIFFKYYPLKEFKLSYNTNYSLWVYLLLIIFFIFYIFILPLLMFNFINSETFIKLENLYLKKSLEYIEGNNMDNNLSIDTERNNNNHQNNKNLQIYGNDTTDNNDLKNNNTQLNKNDQLLNSRDNTLENNKNLNKQLNINNQVINESNSGLNTNNNLIENTTPSLNNFNDNFTNNLNLECEDFDDFENINNINNINNTDNVNIQVNINKASGSNIQINVNNDSTSSLFSNNKFKFINDLDYYKDLFFKPNNNVDIQNYINNNEQQINKFRNDFNKSTNAIADLDNEIKDDLINNTIFENNSTDNLLNNNETKNISNNLTKQKSFGNLKNKVLNLIKKSSSNYNLSSGLLKNKVNLFYELDNDNLFKVPLSIYKSLIIINDNIITLLKDINLNNKDSTINSFIHNKDILKLNHDIQYCLGHFSYDYSESKKLKCFIYDYNLRLLTTKMEYLNKEFINSLFNLLPFDKYIKDIIIINDNFREFYFLNDLDYIVTKNKNKFELDIFKSLNNCKNTMVVLVNETNNKDLKILLELYNKHFNNFMSEYNQIILFKYNNYFKDIKNLDRITNTREIEYFVKLFKIKF